MEGPEQTTVKEIIEFETLEKPQEEPMTETETIQFQIGKPSQQQPLTTSTMVIQESSTTMEVVRACFPFLILIVLIICMF